MTPTSKPFASTTKPALSILLYLDNPSTFTEVFPITLLPEVLKCSGAAVEIIERRKEGVMTHLDDALLARFHEVWFFLADKAPKWQLEDAEVKALRSWMDRGGGVLVTGDHADINEFGQYEGLGRSVGLRIPRARHLRVWDARPGVLAGQIDTTDDDGQPGVDSEKLESDAVPQRLLLPLVRGRLPHEIFLDGDGRRLDRLPDHRHEGRVVVPSLENDVEDEVIVPLANEWPPRAPLPQVIARNVAWRRGEPSDLMVAWDGDVVPFEDPVDHTLHTHGRILADASWHHYVDFNLQGIKRENEAAWATLQALYVNIAAWLAPRWLRKEYTERACDDLAAQPDYVLFGRTDRAIGEQTHKLLERRLPGAWFHALIDDMLAQHAVSRSSALARDFGAVLLGAFMRQRMSRGAMAPVLRATPQNAAPAPGSSLLAQAIASYEDELQAKLAAWTALRATLHHR